jgi:competence ComEA-like helix-hairpin-helix protein
MRAAGLQTFLEHSVAYVKQDLPSKSSVKVIAFLVVAIGVSVSGCVTLPRHYSPATQISFDLRRSQNRLRTNINTASPKELEKLPGIGKVIAERIVTHRTQYGYFRRAEHLMMVRGISDRKFRSLQSMIVVE